MNWELDAQKKTEEKREELRVAEKVKEAKTTFLLNISHDIRTPMNAILGYTKLMRECTTDPEMIHYQEMIEKSSNLLLSIINNALDMARIEAARWNWMKITARWGTLSGMSVMFLKWKPEKRI